MQEYLREVLLEQDEKFLLFGHHAVMLDGCERVLSQAKVAYVRIDGGTPQQARNLLVHRFQEEEGVKVALLSIQAAGVGLTLTVRDGRTLHKQHVLPLSVPLHLHLNLQLPTPLPLLHLMLLRQAALLMKQSCPVRQGQGNRNAAV